MELLDRVVVLFLKFFEHPLHCFPYWLDQFTVPLIVNKGFLFSTSTPVFVISCLFDDGHKNWYCCKWQETWIWSIKQIEVYFPYIIKSSRVKQSLELVQQFGHVKADICMICLVLSYVCKVNAATADTLSAFRDERIGEKDTSFISPSYQGNGPSVFIPWERTSLLSIACC